VKCGVKYGSRNGVFPRKQVRVSKLKGPSCGASFTGLEKQKKAMEKERWTKEEGKRRKL